MVGSQGKLTTVQGDGYPVPAALGGGQAGPQPSTSNNRSVSAVGNLATETSNSTSTRTPAKTGATAPSVGSGDIFAFSKSNRMVRSPVKETGPFTPLVRLADLDFNLGGASKSIESNIFRSPSRQTQCATQQEIENVELRRRLSEIEKVASQLSNEIAKLKKENEELKKPKLREVLETPLTTYNEISTLACTNAEFHTDDEELSRETDWVFKQRKRPRKKRRAEFSPEIGEHSQAKVTETAKPVPVTQHLQQQEQRKGAMKVKAPPPINVIGITEFADIQALMKSVSTNDYRVVALNNNVWKINTRDPDAYRALATNLTDEGKEWYTYEDKNNREIKVMARGLHPTCKKEDIIEDLKLQKLQIEDAVNILKREKVENSQETKIIKRGLPLFMLTFNKSEKIENIYNIKAILNMRVKIEPLKKNTRLIPQCKKCQGYNHTQRYCGREARCVKCAGRHNAKECSVSRTEPARCINCKGQHPANYRGCEVAVQLQRLRNKTRKSTQNTNVIRERIPSTTRVPPQPEPLGPERKSYSQIMQQSTNTTKENPLERIFRSIETINARLAKQERGLEAIYKRLDRQEATNELSSMLY